MFREQVKRARCETSSERDVTFPGLCGETFHGIQRGDLGVRVKSCSRHRPGEVNEAFFDRRYL